MADEDFDEAEAAAFRNLKTSLEKFQTDTGKKFQDILDAISRLSMAQPPPTPPPPSPTTPTQQQSGGESSNPVPPNSLDRTQSVAKDPSDFGAHKVFDETPTSVDDSEVKLIDGLLKVSDDLNEEVDSEVSHLNLDAKQEVSKVTKEENLQTIVQDEDRLTEELLVHVVLDRAEEPAQIEMKDEPVVVSPLSVFNAHQVFDQMPKSLISCEFKLWDELPTKTEVLGKEELDLGSLLVSSYEEQNDRKGSEVGRLNESGDLIMLLILLPLEVYTQKGYARILCFDPGGGALLVVDHSHKLEAVAQEKSELQICYKKLTGMTNSFGVCLSNVFLSHPLSTEVLDQQIQVNVFSKTSYLDSIAQVLDVSDAYKIVVAACVKVEAKTWSMFGGLYLSKPETLSKFSFDPGGEWLMLSGMVHKWKGGLVTSSISSFSSVSVLLILVGACVEFVIFDPGGEWLESHLVDTYVIYVKDYYICLLLGYCFLQLGVLVSCKLLLLTLEDKDHFKQGEMIQIKVEMHCYASKESMACLIGLSVHVWNASAESKIDASVESDIDASVESDIDAILILDALMIVANTPSGRCSDFDDLHESSMILVFDPGGEYIMLCSYLLGKLLMLPAMNHKLRFAVMIDYKMVTRGNHQGLANRRWNQRSCCKGACPAGRQPSRSEHLPANSLPSILEDKDHLKKEVLIQGSVIPIAF